MYEKTGFFKDSLANNRGFGYTHSGEFATVDDFLHFDVFKFGPGAANDQRRTDVIAFVMSMSVDTHAGVGVQVTLDGSNNDAADVVELLDLMMRLADDGDVDVVVRGRQAGATRGYVYLGDGVFQADRAGEQISADAIRRRS
ncbi:MAG: hypothetical protein IH788_01440 [Nitrospinae bacterium]|nr:hypothetical protein [Nitrospinota bacterium]